MTVDMYSECPFDSCQMIIVWAKISLLELRVKVSLMFPKHSMAPLVHK